MHACRQLGTAPRFQLTCHLCLDHATSCEPQLSMAPLSDHCCSPLLDPDEGLSSAPIDHFVCDQHEKTEFALHHETQASSSAQLRISTIPSIPEQRSYEAISKLNADSAALQTYTSCMGKLKAAHVACPFVVHLYEPDFSSPDEILSARLLLPSCLEAVSDCLLSTDCSEQSS